MLVAIDEPNMLGGLMKTSRDAGRTKQVGIWLRVSAEDQARGDNPEHHERRARFHAESKGWNVKEVYHLEAVSGSLIKGRAERVSGGVR